MATVKDEAVNAAVKPEAVKAYAAGPDTSPQTTWGASTVVKTIWHREHGAAARKVNES